MDFSNFIGGDPNSIDWDALLKKALSGQEGDPSAARRAGLLSAGLGILANAHKGFSGAVGEGGLLGVNAYSAERQRQQKDPMQQIGLANALMSLRGGLDKQAALRDWQGGMMPGGGPQIPNTPTDNSGYMGDSQAAPGPSQFAQMLGRQQQMGVQPSYDAVLKGAASQYPEIREPAKNLFDMIYKPFELTKGSVRVAPGQTGQFAEYRNTDPSVPVFNPQTGRYENAPGSAEADAERERLKTVGTEGVKAAQDVITSYRGAVPQQAVRGELVKTLSGQQDIPPGATGKARDLSAAYAAYVKSGTREPFRYTPPPDVVPLGTGVDPAIQAARQAGMVQQATMPGELTKSAQTGSNEDFIKNEYRPAMAAAANSKQTLVGLDVISKQDVKTGWGTTAKAYGARVFEGLGMAPDSAKKLAADSVTFNQVLNTEMWRLLGEQKGPQTEGDAERAKATFANLDSPEAANKLTIAMHRAMHNQAVEKAKFYNQNYASSVKSGDPFALESAWQNKAKSLWDDPALAPYKAKSEPSRNKPSPADVEAEIKRRGL